MYEWSRSVATVIVAAFVIAACAPFASSTPVTVPSGSPIAFATPAPSASVVATPTARAASPVPTDTPPAITAAPFTAAERTLLNELRKDARVACAPRRDDLPPGATTGVECRLSTGLVDRVGVYGFVADWDGDAADVAVRAYLERMASHGVEPGEGNCQAGLSGDRSWPDYLPDEGRGGYRSERSGCFLDENGIANVRVTCYRGVYIGILGKSDDLAALYRWAWRIADGESPERDPPGICAKSD